MGGCCSSSPKSYEVDNAPTYLYCPQASEEHGPLSFTCGTTSAISPGLLVDTNLDTSSPDAYRAPPPPLPYDVGLVCSQTSPTSFGNSSNKTDPMLLTKFQPPGGIISYNGPDASATCEGVKESNCKDKSDCGHGSPKLTEDEPSKFSEPITSTMEEEDVCPTCLEEYDVENPRIITKCEHHFHLSCILEWMERSDTCPICDKIMIFDPTFDD